MVEKTLSASIDAELYQKFRMYCLSEGTTITAEITRMVCDQLNEDSGGLRKKHIYIGMDDGTEEIKIGISSRPENRMAEHGGIRLLWCSPERFDPEEAYRIETCIIDSLTRVISPSRGREWFLLHPGESELVQRLITLVIKERSDLKKGEYYPSEHWAIDSDLFTPLP